MVTIRHGIKPLAASLCFLFAASAQAQVLAGPGSWSANQTWAADSVNGGTLSGYFYWPASPPSLANKRALVLVLHGCSQTAAGDVVDSASDGGFNWKTVAEQYGAVILAPNATGNVYSNHCWDYTNPNPSRSTGHSGVLLDLISRFTNNPQYAIDPKQVYVTGLSSGGGQTMALACLAPDIFAGAGINAGPPPGTTAAQISYVPSGTTSATAAAKCSSLAGSNSASFATQISSVIWGTSDYTVAQAYGPMDAAALRASYGGSFSKGATASLPGGGSNTPYTDGAGKLRTTEISVSGMGHSWPAGAGGQSTHYVDASHVNYPVFLMNFWYTNNLRVSSVAAPVMTSCAASVAGNAVTISGAASDSAGTVSSYRVVLSGSTPVDDAAAGSGASFSIGYALANGGYTGSVTATDSGTGQTSAACTLTPFTVGPAPVIAPPANVAVGAVTASTVALNWSSASGASGYHVYRDGSKLTATAISATSYSSTGLTAATTYGFQVSSVAADGAESALSGAVTATTAPASTCSTVTSSNYGHVLAGRAHDSFGYALANGSNQLMGLDNVFFSSTLAQTAAGYYVVGSCP